MDTTPEKQQRIVIYRLGSLGDTVVALPCFHKVAETWPDAERIVLTNFPVSSKAAPLDDILRGAGLIHDAIEYPVGTRSIGRLWRLSRRLQRLNADALVYLAPPRGLAIALRDWLFFKICGFKRIVGTPLSSDLQTCRRTAVGGGASMGVLEHECERLARCMAPLGVIDLDDARNWDLGLTETEMHAGTAVLSAFRTRQYFAMNMGGKAREKDWGLSNWRDLAARLSELFPEAGLLIVGAAQEADRARQVGELWSGPVVDTCGRLSPRESAAAMGDALVFIGHDSGPLHLAAAVGVKCVGLFGDYNQPKRWHPRGQQHRIIHCMSGLDSIGVAEVVDAVRDVVPLLREYA